MAMVTVELQDDIAQYIRNRVRRENLAESEIVAELVHSGFDLRLRSLYRLYQEGEIGLSYMAEQLGVTTWRLYHLLEERGLRTANI